MHNVQWPGENQPADLSALAEVMKDAFCQGAKWERIDQKGDILWDGPEDFADFGGKMSRALSLSSLSCAEQSGKDFLAEFFTLALQLGIEQGKRALAADTAAICMRNDLRRMAGYLELIEDVAVRAEAAASANYCTEFLDDLLGPDGQKPGHAGALTDGLVRAFRKGARWRRINKTKDIVWHGPENMTGRECAPDFAWALSAENLRYSHEEQDRDFLKEILVVALQLGMEQGKRIVFGDRAVKALSRELKALRDLLHRVSPKYAADFLELHLDALERMYALLFRQEEIVIGMPAGLSAQGVCDGR